MCYTKWCYGDCEECVREKQNQKDFEDSQRVCPHKDTCILETVSVKQDICKTCGKEFNY